MKQYPTIQILSASGLEVIIFLDKITHIYVTNERRTMIKMVNEQGVLTDLSLNEIMTLINEVNGVK